MATGATGSKHEANDLVARAFNILEDVNRGLKSVDALYSDCRVHRSAKNLCSNSNPHLFVNF